MPHFTSACRGLVIVSTASVSWLACDDLHAAAPVFNAGVSSLMVTHDPDITDTTVVGGEVIAFPAIQGATPGINFSSTIPLPGGTNNTIAKFGLGRTTTSTKAGVVFAALSGVSQKDVGGLTPTSQLKVDFTLVWDVTSKFGPPISAGFSVPVAFDVPGLGGVGNFTPHITWTRIVNSGVPSDGRTPYSPGTTSKLGVFAGTSSFTAPAAAFSPSPFLNQAGIDQFILTGTLIFGANNAQDEVVVQIPLDLGDDIVQFHDAGGIEILPEPGAGALMVGAMGGLMMSRRRLTDRRWRCR